MIKPTELLERFLRVTTTLSRLLKIDLMNRRDGQLAISVRAVIELNQNGLIDLSELEILKLDILASNLETIERFDPKLLRLFARKLKSRRIDDYIGALCEVNTACVFINNGVQFVKMESPDEAADFTSGKLGMEFYVECASVHITDKKNRDLKYKIKSTLMKKSKRAYCNKQTALFIEITNIQYHSQATVSKLNPNVLRAYFTQALKSYEFGSLLLFSYVADLDKPISKLSWCYVRIDNDEIDLNLATFLAKCFPLGNYRIRHSLYPYAG